MKEYLIRIVGITLICSILTMIIPKGKNFNVICGAMKIICLLVIVAPVLLFFQNKDNRKLDKIYQEIFSDSVIQVDEEFINYYSESTIDYLEKQVEKEILEMYNHVVWVSVDWEYAVDKYQEIYPDVKVKITQMHVKAEDGLKEEEKKVLSEFLMKNYCSEVLIE